MVDSILSQQIYAKSFGLLPPPLASFFSDFDRALSAGGRDPKRIEAVSLTHLHGDHCGGVPILLMAGMFDSKRERPLTILESKDAQSHLDQLREVLFPGSRVMHPRFQVTCVEISPGENVPHYYFFHIVNPVQPKTLQDVRQDIG